MSGELATRGPNAEAIEQALVQGNLASLTPAQRVTYYNRVCESVGLNPLTKPFEYITLNGKLTLYARKDCTDQLRTIRGISIEKPDITFQDEWIVVTVQARDGTGRTDSDIGVVNKKDMRGDFGNAVMKAVTKAKRRVTLSMCGLGMLDETEVESIPAARTYTAEEAHGGELIVSDPRQIAGVKSGADLRNIDAELMSCPDLESLRVAFMALTPEQRARHAAAKDKRKAELTEGENSLPPSASSATPSGAAAPATTAADSVDSTPADARIELPKAPKKLTANYVSDLLLAVAERTQQRDLWLIDQVCKMNDSPTLDDMNPAQLAAAVQWLRDVDEEGVAA